MAETIGGSQKMVYLSQAGVVELTPSTALVGHDGWADARLGDFDHSDVVLNDYVLIDELRQWRDPFNLGGFSKVQPYLTRTAQMHALADDVKPFVRAYFNAAASVVNLETLTCSEHFAGLGASTNSESMGHFLEQTRWMLVMERGDELWLAPFVTNNWLKDGLVVAVRNAPTRFGKVSYRIHSSAAKGFITIKIDPPGRNPPKAIVLRVRHPDGKQMAGVTVNGMTHASFDKAAEVVRLPGSAKPLTLVVRY